MLLHVFLFMCYFSFVLHFSVSQKIWSFFFFYQAVLVWAFQSSWLQLFPPGFLCRWCWSETPVLGKHVYLFALKTELSWLAASSPPWASTLGWVQINGTKNKQKTTHPSHTCTRNTLSGLIPFVKLGHRLKRELFIVFICPRAVRSISCVRSFTG